jgi:hypothetical protein
VVDVILLLTDKGNQPAFNPVERNAMNGSANANSKGYDKMLRPLIERALQ